MPFCDLALSRRLENAEGHACLRYAQARKRLFPDNGSEWIACGGGLVVFDGIDSPVTQSFGLGLSEELNTETLDIVEQFFRERGAGTMIELSPLSGVPAGRLLCDRGYRPIEISSVLYREVTEPAEKTVSNIRVRTTGADEATLWAHISSRGWAHEHPELLQFLEMMGEISTAREQGACFLAEIGGVPGAAGSLCLHEGVALFAGAATVPELRRRGLQGALLEARMRYAFVVGCDLAMMVAEAGSESQRNAERKGFRIAYTRTKWRLSS